MARLTARKRWRLTISGGGTLSCGATVSRGGTRCGASVAALTWRPAAPRLAIAPAAADG